MGFPSLFVPSKPSKARIMQASSQTHLSNALNVRRAQHDLRRAAQAGI